MTIRSLGHAELAVEDVDKTAEALCGGYGFVDRPVPGGVAAGRMLASGGARLLLVPGDADAYSAGFLARHGDGVAALAVGCQDPAAVARRAVAAGARPAAGEHAVELFPDLALRFVEEVPAPESAPGLFEAIDHVAVCVPTGTMRTTVRLCERALGMRRVFAELVEVGAQAMDSVVVQSASRALTFTFLEPCRGRPPGQIDDFLAAHGGAGVQHLALRTGDVVTAVRTLRERQVDFLGTPGSYYDRLPARLGPTGIRTELLRDLDVLVDRDHDGELFQIFARSTHPRRTFFFELLERRGALSFGTANIKALYEAVARGNTLVGDDREGEDR